VSGCLPPAELIYSGAPLPLPTLLTFGPAGRFAPFQVLIFPFGSPRAEGKGNQVVINSPLPGSSLNPRQHPPWGNSFFLCFAVF